MRHQDWGGGPAVPQAQCSTVGGEMSSPPGHACRSLYDFGCPFPRLGLGNPRLSSNGSVTTVQVRGRDLPPSPPCWGKGWPGGLRATCRLRPWSTFLPRLQANLSEAAHKAPQCSSHGRAAVVTPAKDEVAVHLGETLGRPPTRPTSGPVRPEAPLTSS